ncbi:MAG: SDR family NAD(P)-dependent oxidoreductase [Saccharofermentanales bacterium]
MDKCVIITGGSSGIGRHTAVRLAAEGYRCVLIARTYEKLEEVKESLLMVSGGKHICLPYDLTDIENIHEIFDKIRALGIKDLYGLVHCAGISPLLTLDDNDIKLMLDTYKINVFSFIELCKYFIRGFDRTDGGSIVAISSITAEASTYRQCIYGSSKAALNGTIKHIAKSGIEKKIRVNAIAPGVVNTDMLRRLFMDQKSNEENIAHMAPLGLIPPNIIADNVANLLSEHSIYTTGTIIKIDSGSGLK